ncbi:hypothetical protein VCR5J5_240311 [Vibrio crassostreae]|uniref:Uncharacterized protein n=1 Tax=Vibrio crassostreae TaxID=246167 RepID=A0A822N005_9VIBR|nr:hypothetical protein VCR5J5_240311 [Vibrio crassostreae]
MWGMFSKLSEADASHRNSSECESSAAESFQNRRLLPVMI